MALDFTDISTTKPNSNSFQKCEQASLTSSEHFTTALTLKNELRHFLLAHQATMLIALLLLYILTASAGAFQVFINA